VRACDDDLPRQHYPEKLNESRIAHVLSIAVGFSDMLKHSIGLITNPRFKRPRRAVWGLGPRHEQTLVRNGGTG